MRKVVIGSTERGLLFKDKQFARVLPPGTYRFFDFVRSTTVEVVDIARTVELRGTITKALLANFTEALAQYLEKIVTGPREVAVVYLNDEATVIMAPGDERLFWKGLRKVSVKRFDITENYAVPREVLRDLSELKDESAVLAVRVPEQGRGLVFEAGVVAEQLAPGSYGFWRAQRELSSMIVDTRLTALEVSGQEMLTKDKVSLRINLAVTYRLVDVLAAVRTLSDIQAEIYRTAQLALRQAVGEKTLDELLERKELLNKSLAEELAGKLAQYGIEVARLGVKDIILPGEMRTLLNQVVEAEKAAEAQNIRRREETAATRSLLNTAKLLESNPVLLRLKELEAVERISDKIEKLTVFDGLDGVMKGLVSLSK